MLESIEANLRSKIGSIRDPETGEFPLLVVSGRSLDSLSVKVEGSPDLIKLVEERLGSGDQEGEVLGLDSKPPVAFLCHASEDKVLVRRLAEDLMAQGIDVFKDHATLNPNRFSLKDHADTNSNSPGLQGSHRNHGRNQPIPTVLLNTFLNPSVYPL